MRVCVLVNETTLSNLSNKPYLKDSSFGDIRVQIKISCLIGALQNKLEDPDLSNPLTGSRQHQFSL